MASNVTVQYQIDDEETVTVSIACEGEHPDAMDQIATRAVKVFRESLMEVYAVNRAVSEMDDDEDGEDDE
jgi:capsular polysaccharide biosynthesis protein